MSEENKPGPKPKVTVQILEMRGVPASGGVFLREHRGLTQQEFDAGDKEEYKKLVPGESQTMLKSDFDELPDATKELLKVV